MSEKRINFLIERYLESKCLPNEKEELFKMVDSGIYDELLKTKIGDGLFNSSVDYKLDQNSSETIWSLIQAASNPRKTASVRKLQFIPRWMWAAASVLVLLASAWFWFQYENSRQQPPTAFNNKSFQDIAPGHNGAILTLSDGKQVVLDSLGNGTITTQNGTKVVMINGQLAYDPAEKLSGEMTYNTMTTPKGRMFNIMLPDGTEVWLNSGSSIKYPTAFTGHERKVELTGEGYFEVKHNKEKPFIVTANNTSIEVLGTHFNVNAYSDESFVKTTLLEGSVKVSNGNKSMLIVPGEQASTSSSSGLINIKKDLNMEAVVAWKNGKFYFDNADIKSIMSQIARWYNVDVEYKGNVSKIFGGTISRNISASNVFKILEATGGVHFTIEGRKVIVEPASQIPGLKN